MRVKSEQTAKMIDAGKKIYNTKDFKVGQKIRRRFWEYTTGSPRPCVERTIGYIRSIGEPYCRAYIIGVGETEVRACEIIPA